jgi:hypothetical protein
MHRKIWRQKNKRTPVPAYHEICSVHQNHHFCHGCLSPTGPLLVTFITQMYGQTEKSAASQIKHQPPFQRNIKHRLHKTLFFVRGKRGDPRHNFLNQIDQGPKGKLVT